MQHIKGTRFVWGLRFAWISSAGVPQVRPVVPRPQAQASMSHDWNVTNKFSLAAVV